MQAPGDGWSWNAIDSELEGATWSIPCGPSFELPGQDSNLDKESQNLLLSGPNPLPANAPRAPPAAPRPRLDQTDPDLARILDTWPALPPHIKAAVLALIQTVAP